MNVFIDPQRYGYWIVMDAALAWVVPAVPNGWADRVAYDEDGPLIPTAPPISDQILEYVGAKPVPTEQVAKGGASGRSRRTVSRTARAARGSRRRQ
jgi:hypothetical protein